MKMHIRSKTNHLLIAQIMHVEFPELTLITVDNSDSVSHAQFELDTPDEQFELEFIERLIARSAQLVTV